MTLPGTCPGHRAEPAGADDVGVLVVGDDVVGLVVVGLVVVGLVVVGDEVVGLDVVGFVVVGFVVVGAVVLGRWVVGDDVDGLLVGSNVGQRDVQNCCALAASSVATFLATKGSDATRLCDWSPPKLACAL